MLFCFVESSSKKVRAKRNDHRGIPLLTVKLFSFGFVIISVSDVLRSTSILGLGVDGQCGSAGSGHRTEKVRDSGDGIFHLLLMKHNKHTVHYLHE